MESNSLKGLLQGVAKSNNSGVLQGVVLSASPLKIKVVNDDKLILNNNVLIVPWHLTDYTTTATFSLDDGAIDSVTIQDGNHNHNLGVHGGHTSGDGSHEHTGGYHTHALNTFKLNKGTMTVFNALKVDETVFLLSLDEGKKYYILDRVV